MAAGSAYIHFYQKISRAIFHKVAKEIGVKGVSFYHHQ
jgi:hypothetical protein